MWNKSPQPEENLENQTKSGKLDGIDFSGLIYTVLVNGDLVCGVSFCNSKTVVTIINVVIVITV